MISLPMVESMRALHATMVRMSPCMSSAIVITCDLGVVMQWGGGGFGEVRVLPILGVFDDWVLLMRGCWRVLLHALAPLPCGGAVRRVWWPMGVG